MAIIHGVDAHGVPVRATDEEFPVSLWLSFLEYERALCTSAEWREAVAECELPIIVFVGGAFQLRFRSEHAVAVFKLHCM